MNDRWKLPPLVVTVLALGLAAGCAQKQAEGPRKADVRAKNASRQRSSPERTENAGVVLAGMGGGGVSPAATQPDSSLEAEDMLLAPEPYYYESVGRRDYFESLVSEEYAAANPAQRPASAELRVVGILWGELDRFALVETAQGRSRVLREGDTLGDGTVVRVLPDRVIIHVTEFGGARTVTLPLVEGGGFDESPKARRR